MTTDLFSIPQANPLAGYLAHREAIDAAIKAALEGGRYIRGPQTIAFEHEFAEFLGVNFVVGVGSGTDALALSLRALRIGPGDAVATVSHTAVATVAAIEMVGAVPVLVDINEEDGLIDLAGLQKAILEPVGYRLKAVIPVHLYGRPANLLTLCTIARESGLKVIEDCAQAHGASFAGRRVGALPQNKCYFESNRCLMKDVTLRQRLSNCRGSNDESTQQTRIIKCDPPTISKGEED